MGITWNIKHSKYQIIGKEKIYLFDFTLSQEIKNHIDKFSSKKDIDEFYSNAPRWIKKDIEVMEKPV